MSISSLSKRILNWLKTPSRAPLPVLERIEIPIVEHCNLNCKRCAHFSSIAPETFLSVDSFARDLRRLASLFSDIRLIRLYGGEPLLHPQRERFLEIARAEFPNCTLQLITNGLLLGQAGESFWETCRRTGTEIDWSVYAPMEKKSEEFAQLCESRGVRLNSYKMPVFYAQINPQGDSDPQEAFRYCRSRGYYPFLHGSRLHVCQIPPTVAYFNRKFGRSIPTGEGIDIHEVTMTGQRVLDLLETPVSTCRFCAYPFVDHSWERGANPDPRDWEVSPSLPASTGTGPGVTWTNEWKTESSGSRSAPPIVDPRTGPDRESETGRFPVSDA